jgi:hypothetical protein
MVSGKRNLRRQYKDFLMISERGSALSTHDNNGLFFKNLGKRLSIDELHSRMENSILFNKAGKEEAGISS